MPSLGWEDPLEKGMATHSSSLAWRIPWAEEPEGYSPWGCKESDTTERQTLSHFLSPAHKSHLHVSPRGQAVVEGGHIIMVW